MIDEEEYVDIVDENDIVIGKETKENKIKKNLISRNVIIFVVDKNKNLFITKRSPHKRTCPNMYDVSAVGNIKSGESPEKAAERELKEELNIKCDLKFFGKLLNEFYDGDLFLRYYSYVFLGTHHGDIKLGTELTELKKVAWKDVKSLVSSNKDQFTPGFLKDFELVKEHLK